MLPHFLFHSEMLRLEGSKYKARRLEARGSKARHIEYSSKVGKRLNYIFLDICNLEEILTKVIRIKFLWKSYLFHSYMMDMT